jgi:hypothetical protein
MFRLAFFYTFLFLSGLYSFDWQGFGENSNFLESSNPQFGKGINGQGTINYKSCSPEIDKLQFSINLDSSDIYLGNSYVATISLEQGDFPEETKIYASKFVYDEHSHKINQLLNFNKNFSEVKITPKISGQVSLNIDVFQNSELCRSFNFDINVKEQANKIDFSKFKILFDNKILTHRNNILTLDYNQELPANIKDIKLSYTQIDDVFFRNKNKTFNLDKNILNPKKEGLIEIKADIFNKNNKKCIEIIREATVEKNKINQDNVSQEELEKINKNTNSNKCPDDINIAINHYKDVLTIGRAYAVEAKSENSLKNCQFKWSLLYFDPKKFTIVKKEFGKTAGAFILIPEMARYFTPSFELIISNQNNNYKKMISTEFKVKSSE